MNGEVGSENGTLGQPRTREIVDETTNPIYSFLLIKEWSLIILVGRYTNSWQAK